MHGRRPIGNDHNCPLAINPNQAAPSDPSQAELSRRAHRKRHRQIPAEVAPNRVRSDRSRPTVDLALSLKRRLKVK